MDLAQATGTPEDLTLGGETHAVRLLTMKEWGSLSAFLKRENPSPVTRALTAIQQAKAAGTPLDPATRDELLDHAQRSALSWPPRLGSEAWFDALARVEGGEARLLFEVLSKTDATFTVERAEALAPKIASAEWADLIRVSYYGAHPRPKAAPPATPAGA